MARLQHFFPALFGLALVGLSSPAANAQPAEWTCSASFYDAGDGCDCNCGAYDPDCADVDATVFGCGPAADHDGCNLDGECRHVPDEWICDASYYDTADGLCDCACGVYDPDCDDVDNLLLGCPTGAESCNADATCRVVPTDWTCDSAFWDDTDDICDCECGAYDPDCDVVDAPLIGCPVGAEGCNLDATCDVVPAEWTCAESFYDAGDGCDCDCGAPDPDCEDPTADLFNCPDGAFGCNADGTCDLIPPEWTCSDTFYDAGDGCDCDCGAYDPDCDLPDATLFGCSPDASGCNPDGTCNEVPADWTCTDTFYGDGLFCDCDCGVFDPDCDDPTNSVMGCPAGAFGCNADGTCALTPPDWTCNDSWFGDGQFCDCACGAGDPDCDLPDATLFGCPQDAIGCSADGVCEMPVDAPPPEWFCNAAVYNNADGCDCGCGAYDPDCDLPDANLFGCPQGSPGCAADGTCEAAPNQPPPEWSCSSAFYDAADGCDCNCGAPDPDCDLPDQTLFGCPADVETCNADGTCGDPVGGPVVPPGWTCDAADYNTANGCDCACGVYDPDCDLGGAELKNCPNDAIGCSAEAECRVPACVPDCTGQVCGGDGCGGSCGTCGADQTCNAGQCEDNTPDIVPPEWTCPAGAYNDGANCNCACGALDPDCGNPAAPVVGCPQGAACTADAVCEEPSAGPEGWTCNIAYYDAADGCDCNCGVYDPDCDIADAQLYGCTPGAEGCAADGTCIGGAAPPPAEWTCSASSYGTADGCDCNCGVYDPDCDDSSATIYGCSQGTTGCDANGECVEGACVPDCTGAVCGDDGCGGSCGSCPSGETCDVDGQCVTDVGPEPDPEPSVDPDPEPGVVPPPDAWTCAAANYDAGDGCHCGCGVFDPDCEDTGAEIIGCGPDAIGCDADAKCVEECTDTCGERACGVDACGNVCGICDDADFCSAEGACQPRAVDDPGRGDGADGGPMDGGASSGCTACEPVARSPYELALLVGLAGLMVRRRRRAAR